MCWFGGVPAADIRLETAARGTPFYHTALETSTIVERYIDSDGEVLAALARLWLDAALQLADEEAR